MVFIFIATLQRGFGLVWLRRGNVENTPTLRLKPGVTQTLCFSSYLDLQVVSLVLGFMSGNWTLTPYVTSQLVGVERLAEAHGVLMFFGGVGLTLGPPVVGKAVSGSGLVSVR